jgi:type IV pilus assembly protein PilP
MNNVLKHLLAVAVVAASSVACEEEVEETGPVATTKKETEKVDEGVKAEKKAADQSYSYEVIVNGQPRRDPFKTYFDELEGAGMAATNEKATTELQRIELDKLKLVAVIVGTATPMAMVEEPGGKGHTLKIGTLVGKRLGQVKHIRRGEVVIQEEFRDFTGKRIPQLKQLRIDAEDTP